MKLFYSPGACSLATHIVLEWIGKPYALQKVTIHPAKSPELLKVNPLGAVPVIEEHGWTLNENSAVLNYLADANPEAGLGGDGSAKGRAEVNRWLGFMNSDLHPAFKPLFGATGYLADAAMIERTREEARHRLRRLFEVTDRQLDGRDWIAGSRSIADPYLFVVTRWAKAQKLDLTGLANLEGHFERMQADPGVQRVIKQETAAGIPAGH